MITEIDRAQLQGNILEGYGAQLSHSLSVCLRFVDAASGCSAIASLLPRVTRARLAAGPPLASPTLNLGLSFAGLSALALPDSLLQLFPEAFRVGMQARAELLGDDPDRFDELWKTPKELHLWLWLHATDRDELERFLRELTDLIGPNAETVTQPMYSEDLYSSPVGGDGGSGRYRIEHFGFRDGIGRPSIVGSYAQPRPGEGKWSDRKGWEPIATGEFVLGHLDEAGDVPGLKGWDWFSRNGTFAVIRALEQDVAGFEQYLKTEAARLGVDPEFIATRMVGRERDGRPLNTEAHSVASDLNDFRFGEDPAGRTCPLGAHIRRANPRDGHAFASAFARHRIVRRGKAYGPRIGGAAGARERGLLFIALNACLERQFEFLQNLYMNDGSASGQGAEPDPLVGASTERAHFVIPGDPANGRTTLVAANVARFVECRGGEYFFLPSLHALEWIARRTLVDRARPSIQPRDGLAAAQPSAGYARASGRARP